MTIFWKAMNDQFCLKIEHDTDAPNPRREFDNLGTMVCWHRQYNLGDEHRYASARDFMESLAEEFEIKRIDEKSDAELFKQVEKHVLILPIYAYEHGAITIRTSAFSCPWDSGQIGWIYVSKAQAREEYGRLIKKTAERIENVLKGEVEEYDQYLQGDVYGFTLYNVDATALHEHLQEHLSGIGMEVHDLTFDEWLPFLSEIDSCWGFFGRDHEKNGITDQLPAEAQPLIAELKEGVVTEIRKFLYA